jgi:hypothetical protein
MLDQVALPLECNDPTWGLSRVTAWDLELCWRPQTCFLSGQQLWGRRAYHGERWITGPGEPVVVHHWIEKNEFIMWQLKK